MKIKFLIQGKNDPTNIYVFLSAGLRKEYKRKTGKSINPKNWDVVTNSIKGRTAELNNLRIELEKLKIYIDEAFNKDKPTGVEITGDWLQNQINLFFGKATAIDLDILTNYRGRHLISYL